MAKQPKNLPILPRCLVLLVAGSIWACASGTRNTASDDELLEGTIAYPFAEEGTAVGSDHPADERFIIRSAVGAREYTIEIPGAARDYDVQVPIGDIGETDADVLAGRRPKDLANPVTTDKEMLANMPRLERDRASDTALMDSAFGAGDADGPRQAPSYTLGLARVNDLYKQRKYEFALVELNSMLTFFPNSPQLHKMKGTVLLKMRNLPLAELSWIKALELNPRDKSVRMGLDRLQRRILNAGQGQAANATDSVDNSIPKPVGTVPAARENVLGH